jgi:hypothetical protein
MANFRLILISILCVSTFACNRTSSTKEEVAITLSEKDSITNLFTPVDKNDPQSVLYAFQKFVIFFAGKDIFTKDMECSLDIIMDSLAHNGKYSLFVVNDTITYHKKNEEELFKDILNVSYICKSEYDLYPEKNTIAHSYDHQDPLFEGREYRLLNLTHKAKFIYSFNDFTDNSTYQDDVKIYDFDPRTGYFSLDSVTTELFRIEAKDFFMESAPDSLAYYEYYFTINRAKKGITECRICLYYGCYSMSYEQLQEKNKWLKGNVIYFDVVDNKFIRSEPYFDDRAFGEPIY